MKLIAMDRIFLILALILFGCSNDNTEVGEKSLQFENTENESSNPASKSSMRNPAVMLGSDLGSIIRKAYQVGDYELMVHLTAHETIAKFGKEKLIECYKNLDMGKEILLKSISQEEDVLMMNYEATDQATKVIVRLPVVIENDTAKIMPVNPCSGSLYMQKD